MIDHVIRIASGFIIVSIIGAISYFVFDFKIEGFNLLILFWLTFNSIDIARLEQDNE